MEKTGLDKRRKMVLLIATIAAFPLYLYCSFNHICMAGHMKHPPYPVYDYISDYILYMLLVTAIVEVCIIKLSLGRKVYLVLLYVLLMMNNVFLGGVFIFLDWALFILLLINAFYLFRLKSKKPENNT
jgi:hypothetical protein